MVDTKDDSNENPKPTFRYEEDGETIDIDVNEGFSDDGKIQFKRLLDYQVQLAKMNEALVNLQLDIQDNLANAERRRNWIMENEINKPEEDNVEVIEEDEGGKR
tara:strand:+ start:108 stop:419 length:312 start_codon:yes stop_codon:yes gene_type:complete